MPTESIINQFSKSDFFGVLPPGFYSFVAVYSWYSVQFITKPSIEPKPSVESLWGILTKLSGAVQEKPATLVFILFASYLIGSVFRAIPVYWAERLIPPFTKDFPYPITLIEVLATLNAYPETTKHDINKMPKVDKGVPMHIFNYWKDVLCLRSPEGFAYYQTFETRVRFFAGMIWAGLIGSLSGGYLILRFLDLKHPTGLPLFLLSSILLIIFSSNFRRVRRQEARSLVTIFTAYVQECERPGSRKDQPNSQRINI